MPTLDFSDIRVANLPAAKRKLEIPAAGAPSNSVVSTITATQNIPAYSVVTSQGKVADSGNVSQSRGKVIGVANGAIANGFTGSVVEAGEVSNLGWAWATGDVIFLNGTLLSSIAPSTGFVQIIGTAKGPTIIVVELGQPFTF